MVSCPSLVKVYTPKLSWKPVSPEPFQNLIYVVEGNSILVPLTSSLYVRGSLTASDNVLVDVGTGFYVEKDCHSAVEFYTAKIQQVSTNIRSLEGMLEKKSGSLQLVEEGGSSRNHGIYCRVSRHRNPSF